MSRCPGAGSVEIFRQRQAIAPWQVRIAAEAAELCHRRERRLQVLVVVDVPAPEQRFEAVFPRKADTGIDGAGIMCRSLWFVKAE